MNEKIASIQKTGREQNLFFWFLTLVVGGMFAYAVYSEQVLYDQPLRTIALFLLVALHVGLHWSIEKVSSRPSWILPYFLGQSILALVIVYLSHSIGMLFAVYMGLIGESIGVLKITPRGLLAVAYFLALSFASFTQFVEFKSAAIWVISMVPTVLFISIYVTLYNRQAEARQRAQELLVELDEANRQLREYAARVEDLTITAERERMARELHDTLSQGLAGLILQLEAADAHLASQRSDRAKEIIEQAMDRARSALADARQVISNLRENYESTELDELLRHEGERFTGATGIECEMEIKLDEPVPETLCEPILRTVTEALTNIARHAQASQAGIRLSSNGDGIGVEIWDNGKGFDPASIASGHYGLLGMRERVRLAGGELILQSEAGKGTKLSLRFPVVSK